MAGPRGEKTKNGHPQKKRSNHAKLTICHTRPRIIKKAIRLDRSASANTNAFSPILYSKTMPLCRMTFCSPGAKELKADAPKTRKEKR